MVNRNARMPAERGNMNKPCTDNTHKAILSKLQAVDFSLVDVVLYLDAYPNCKKAIEYYHKLLAEKEMLTKKLTEMGIPINNMSNAGEHWKWTDGPWPWEYEANI